MNKLSKPVNALTFSRDSRIMVTVGLQHLKYWYFSENGEVVRYEAEEREGAYIMKGEAS